MISTSWRCAGESWSPIRFIGRTSLEAVFVQALREPVSLSWRRSIKPNRFGSSPDPDVLGDVDAWDDLGFLVDDADAGFVRGLRVRERERLRRRW